MYKALVNSTTIILSCILVPILPGCATPAQSGRSAGLGENADSGPDMFSLYQQVQRLQQQVRELNGRVDTLGYKLKQNQSGQRDLYQNLDKRLNTLEGGGPNTAPGDTGENNAQVDPAIQSAYMDGFNKLKNSNYGAAIASFKTFVAQHPDSNLTDNAWYWLGEAYYVQQNLDSAEHAFETVVNRFNDSPKVAASLYRIGLIQLARNQRDNAQATLQRVVDQYPNSDSADQATQKLQSLGS